MFDSDVAAYLGIDLATCAQEQNRGTSGKGLNTVYRCSVTMHLHRRDFQANVLSNPDFAAGLALLGREDAFRQFQLGFDQRRHLLLLARY